MENYDLIKMSSDVDSYNDLSKFIVALRKDLIRNPDAWENKDLDSFLEAMSGWIADMEGYYINQGISFDGTASWKRLSEILLAARIYE